VVAVGSGEADLCSFYKLLLKCLFLPVTSAFELATGIFGSLATSTHALFEIHHFRLGVERER
jgi:hypothetical protein